MTDYIDTMLGMIGKWNSTIIICPKCNFHQDLADIDYAEHFVTLWGDEDGPKEYECPECEHKMMVQERVMRSFDIVNE